MTNEKKRSRFTAQALEGLDQLDAKCLELLKSIRPVAGASRLRHHIISVQMQVQDSRRDIQDEYEVPK